MKRRDLLRSTAALPAIATGGIQEAEAARSFKGMNVILFITDQERAPQHFPAGWVRRHQPATQRLMDTGMTFNNAFCNSCMCSPSRSTLFTGYFPAQHGVVDTLSFGNTDSLDEPVLPLPQDLPNLATAFEAAGYHVSYKGKWHLSKPEADPNDPHAWTPDDAAMYGFDRWDPPDAGHNASPEEFGGGAANHDHRFVKSRGRAADGEEGVLDYLRSPARRQQPFFLIVSLVNPHDVLAYPRTWRSGGYRSARRWLEGEIDLPATWDEDLSTKPTAQQDLIPQLALGIGALPTRRRKLRYLNFYGNLISHVDQYLEDILRTLERTRLLDDTLVIKTSDHGEMGMAHGGMRQKAFNFYEETLRVPLVFSNPKLFPRGRQSNALVSHVDLLPTLASLLNVPKSARANWQGVDYSRILERQGGKSVQNYVAFTFDDIKMGQDTEQVVPPPNRIISLRERRYKLAKYYDADGTEPEQWEMYDLRDDPLERVNIAHPSFTPNARQQKQLDRLKAKLARVEATRLQPL